MSGRFPILKPKADTVRLRIADPSDPAANSISNVFRIIPSFTLTAPNGNADANLTEKLKGEFLIPLPDLYLQQCC